MSGNCSPMAHVLRHYEIQYKVSLNSSILPDPTAPHSSRNLRASCKVVRNSTVTTSKRPGVVMAACVLQPLCIIAAVREQKIATLQESTMSQPLVDVFAVSRAGRCQEGVTQSRSMNSCDYTLSLALLTLHHRSSVRERKQVPQSSSSFTESLCFKQKTRGLGREAGSHAKLHGLTASCTTSALTQHGRQGAPAH